MSTGTTAVFCWAGRGYASLEMLTPLRDGRLRFEVYEPRASRMDLVVRTGDTPAAVPMRQDRGGWWAAEVSVSTGSCLVHYVVNGCYSQPDYAAGEMVYDPSGTLATRVVVNPPARQRDSSRPPR